MLDPYLAVMFYPKPKWHTLLLRRWRSFLTRMGIH